MGKLIDVDSFVELSTSTVGSATNVVTEGWDTNSVSVNTTQQVDRPGVTNSMNAAYDANNVYGYDSAYTNMSTYSMNGAAKATVSANKSAQASFEFYGTGFDVVSMTDTTTGTIIVNVYKVDAEGNVSTEKTESLIVDTYYGMNADGTLSANNPTALYQVPVMKVSGLEYGRYHVDIIAAYAGLFDHNKTGTYDFYLDAIRIYNPCGNKNTVANNAYVADAEAWPQYMELRNNIIAASNYTVTENEDGSATVSGTDLSGAIFIDSNDATTSIADYVSYGPNNELYLATGQSIAFKLDQTYASIIADVQIALKVGNGGTVNYKIYDSKQTTADKVTAKTLSTATDLYYSMKDISDGTIVITNTGTSGILSITNIKVTYTQNPYGTSTSSEDEGIMTTSLFMDEEGATFALMSLRSAPMIDDEDTSEPDMPDSGDATDETVDDTTVGGSAGVVEDEASGSTDSNEKESTSTDRAPTEDSDDAVVKDSDDTNVDDSDIEADDTDNSSDNTEEDDTNVEEPVTNIFVKIFNAIFNAISKLLSILFN